MPSSEGLVRNKCTRMKGLGGGEFFIAPQALEVAPLGSAGIAATTLLSPEAPHQHIDEAPEAKHIRTTYRFIGQTWLLFKIRNSHNS